MFYGVSQLKISLTVFRPNFVHRSLLLINKRYRQNQNETSDQIHRLKQRIKETFGRDFKFSKPWSIYFGRIQIEIYLPCIYILIYISLETLYTFAHITCIVCTLAMSKNILQRLSTGITMARRCEPISYLGAIYTFAMGQGTRRQSG